MKFYLHNDTDIFGLREYVQKAYPNKDEHFIETLAADLKSTFYEVEFTVEADERGNLTKATFDNFSF